MNGNKSYAFVYLLFSFILLHIIQMRKWLFKNLALIINIHPYASKLRDV